MRNREKQEIHALIPSATDELLNKESGDSTGYLAFTKGTMIASEGVERAICYFSFMREPLQMEKEKEILAGKVVYLCDRRSRIREFGDSDSASCCNQRVAVLVVSVKRHKCPRRVVSSVIRIFRNLETNKFFQGKAGVISILGWCLREKELLCKLYVSCVPKLLLFFIAIAFHFSFLFPPSVTGHYRHLKLFY